MRKQISQSYRSLLIILALAVTLAAVTGCSKQRANSKVKTAQKRIDAAKNREADKYDKDELAAIEKALQDVISKMAGDPAGALIDATAVVDRATALRDSVFQKQATDKQKQAALDLEVIDANLAGSGNPELYEKIKEAKAEVDQNMADQDFEDCSDNADLVHEQTATLLNERKVKAVGDLEKIKSLVEDLAVEGCQTEVPNQWASVLKRQADLIDLVENQRQYLKAGTAFDDLQGTISDAKNKTYESRLNKAEIKLEGMVNTAKDEEAATFFLEVLTQCEADLATIKELKQKAEYETALTNEELLTPRLATLIEDSRRAAATDRLTKVTDGLRALDAEDVRKYIEPTRMEKIDTTLASAQAQFDIKEYNKCKDICAGGLAELNIVSEDFTKLAENTVMEARSEVAQADHIITRMNDIFKQQELAASSDPLEKAFEIKKKGMQTRLEEIATNASALLTQAEQVIKTNQRHTAIEKSRLAVRKSILVIHDVYRVVAHNAIVELNKSLSAYALNGATEMASKEMASTRNLLAETRGMLRAVEASEAQDASGKVSADAFRDTLAKTSEVRAELETIDQRLKESVGDKINAALKMVSQAELDKAADHATGDLSTSRQAIDEARSLQSREMYKASALKAEQARAIALKASVNSIKSWADLELTAASGEISEAARADADQISGEGYQDTQNKISQARALFQQGQDATSPEEAAHAFRQSKILAVQTRNNAEAVRMSPITKSAEAIATAKRFGAWGHDYPLLVKAILYTRNSVEAMEKEDYYLSNQYALEARKLAQEATDHTKRVTFEARIDKMSEQVQGAMKDSGAHIFSHDALVDFIDRLHKTKGTYSLKEHEAVVAQLDALENDLYRIASSAPDIFNGMVADQRTLHTTLVNRGARQFAEGYMEEAQRKLNHASIDFEKGDLRSAHRLLNESTHLLSSIDNRFKEQEFAENIMGLFDEWDKAQLAVKNVFTLLPAQAVFIFTKKDVESSGRVNATLVGTDMDSYLRNVILLIKKTRGMSYPESMKDEYSQITETFNTALLSAKALDQFSLLPSLSRKEAQQTIFEGFNKNSDSLKMKSKLVDALKRKGLLSDLSFKKLADSNQ